MWLFLCLSCSLLMFHMFGAYKNSNSKSKKKMILLIKSMDILGSHMFHGQPVAPLFQVPNFSCLKAPHPSLFITEMSFCENISLYSEFDTNVPQLVFSFLGKKRNIHTKNIPAGVTTGLWWGSPSSWSSFSPHHAFFPRRSSNSKHWHSAYEPDSKYLLWAVISHLIFRRVLMNFVKIFSTQSVLVSAWFWVQFLTSLYPIFL